MTPKTLFLILCALLILFVAGCGSPATPTKPVATTAPVVITVVVTATPPPATPTRAEPTVVASPTLTLTQVAGTPVAVKATTVPGTPKPAPTKKPTVGSTPTETALPFKYGAARLIEPLFNDLKKDERHFPSDALALKWAAVGAMGGDECYAVSVKFDPGQGDVFLTGCGNQTQAGYAFQFTLNQPRREGPNYSALLPNPWSDTWVTWSVTPVKDLGTGTGPQDKAGDRHKTAPLGPTSDIGKFLLKGG